MNQLSLFEDSNRSRRRPRQESLVMDKDALIKWKQRIFKYQQKVREQEPPQQMALIDLPQKTWHTPDEIDPFSLRLHTHRFWELPEFPEPPCDLNQGFLYFIIDRNLPIILYVGETKLSVNQRWEGTHDCKEYMMSYIEMHRRYDLEVLLCAAFWGAIPPDKKILREWEKELILRWKSPFNKEMWDTWGQPFKKYGD